MPLLLKVLSFSVGLYIIFWTLNSAIRTFVLPRSENVLLTRLIFRLVFKVFEFRLRWAPNYETLDRIMALYAPVAVLALPIATVVLLIVGYMLIYWALGVGTWYEVLYLSGSSLLTLGFAPANNLIEMLVIFSEATLGLGVVALLISYLPTMYSAFTDREAAVTKLEVYAGNPPSVAQMLVRMHRIHGLAHLTELWAEWEDWFVYLEQTHTSLIPLVFFRSPHSGQSWVIAAGTILDAASITASTLDQQRDPQAELCIRAGYIALRNIVDFFGYPYNRNPQPTDPISVSRAEYDEVCRKLAAAGVPLKADLDQAWRDFAGWRVNYDKVLRVLAGLTLAPPAPWSGDRPIRPLIKILHPMLLEETNEQKASQV